MRALITGATSGIGKEIAIQLADMGIDLVLASRGFDKMEELKVELSKKVKVNIISIDLSKANSAMLLYEKIQELSLKIDILVNNAGYGLFGMNSKFDSEMLEGMIILNASTLTTLCQLFSLDMIVNKNGYILNVSSTASYQPIPYFAAYSASKSFVKSFSKALHYELKNFNIGVTCLNPGPTDTNFFEVALKGKRFPPFKGKPMLSAEQVAKAGIKAMFDKKTVITVGLFNKLSSVLFPLVPLFLVERFLRRYFKR